jgi:phage tail-like protein
MVTTQLTDQYGDFRFRIEISGIAVAVFSQATVPGFSADGTDHQGGPADKFLSGLTTLSLSKGVTDGMDLYHWYQLVLQRGRSSPGALKNLSLVLMNADGSEKVVWNIINASPAKYESSGVSVGSSEIMVETLELAMDYMSRVR